MAITLSEVEINLSGLKSIELKLWFNQGLPTQFNEINPTISIKLTLYTQDTSGLNQN